MKPNWKPPTKPKAKPEMTKREFIAQYVLNRARAMDSNLDGKGAATEAFRAWEYIESQCGKGGAK